MLWLPIDTLNRLETMAMMSDVDMPLAALRAQVGSAIDVVVQTARLQDGSRCVTHISQVVGYDAAAGYQIVDFVGYMQPCAHRMPIHAHPQVRRRTNTNQS